ncbi:MAG: hypothetical protein F4Y95_11460 [Chloroflexi bacterium]|nr:hypothetical protein [Chloroflexota bacterium]
MNHSRRFGIGEWYGRSFLQLSAAERRAFATSSVKRPCPYRRDGGHCTKKGGVCSFRYYVEDDGIAGPIVGDGLRVLCPRRFEEDDEIFEWVGETILGTPDPSVAKEVGFLLSEDKSSDVGRIDMVLANEASDLGRLEWCALEIQAVYFSGPAMGDEFRAIREHANDEPPFPSKTRRPDYHSSGPKRLMPQLQIKVPTLRRWGKKMAVVVDREFLNAMGAMEEVEDLSNADIAWFTVDFEEDESAGRFRLVRDRVSFTTLERATEGLVAGMPVPLSEFENRLRARLGG